MNYIIVGCGRVGSQLAYRLFQRGHDVVVVDNLGSRFETLPPEFQGRTVEGDILNEGVLKRAGIETADGLAAVTDSDTLNAVVGHTAASIYKIPNVIVRNYDPHFRALHEAFELQIVSSASWGAQRIEELLYHKEMRTVFSAGNGEVEVYEFTVPERWEGRTLGELLPEAECAAVALTRAGRAMLPDAKARLEQGDVVLVSATFDGIQGLRQHLTLL